MLSPTFAADALSIVNYAREVRIGARSAELAVVPESTSLISGIASPIASAPEAYECRSS